MRGPTARLTRVTPHKGARCVLLCALAMSVSASAKEPTITTFDAPGAGTSAGQGTLAFDITPAGAIVRYYADASSVFHGFLRAKDGTLTTFDAPGAGSGAGQGTLAFVINPAGEIVGLCLAKTRSG